MSGEPTFVDTNVLLYAYDRAAGVKRERAGAALRELWEARSGRLSTQVFQEFAVNALRTLRTPLDSAAVAEIIGAYRVWPVHRVDVDDVLSALSLAAESRISFWDALVVISAARVGASRLYTEDLNDGQVIRGVRITNPFKP